MKRAPKQKLVIDWFAGGGGASTGIRAAIGRPIDIALNHNAHAVAMHRINHPETRHIEGNAWDYTPGRVVRKGAKIALGWFSPDCTFHSNARGGKPFRDASYANRLRGLPHVTSRWARETDMDVFMVENVREMADWGPLSAGKPCPRRKGAHFRRWLRGFAGEGYKVDMRIMAAHEHGAPTSRKRLFIIGRKDGEPIVFPEATHGPGLLPCATAADCIDFSDLGVSIFERERELAEATKRRIARGMVRYVINNPNPFIVPVGFGEREGQAPRIHSLDEPLPTVMASRNRHMLITPFIDKYYSSARQGAAIDEPVSTISANGQHHSLIAPFVTPVKTWGGGGNDARSVELPFRTITSSKRGEHALASAFLVQHQGGYYERKQCVAPPITGPMPTIVSKGCTTQMVACLTSADRDKAHRVAAFIMSYYGTEQAPAIDGPVPTVRTKDHLALVTVHGDPITDIRMRMFKPRELFNAQSFDKRYIIDRGLTEDGQEITLTQTSQVRMVGNSVPPKMAEALVRANLDPYGARQGVLL